MRQEILARISWPKDISVVGKWRSIRPVQRPSHHLLLCCFAYSLAIMRLRWERKSVLLRIPHVLRRLDRWDEFENDIGHTRETNQASKDDVYRPQIEEERAEEKVNYERLELWCWNWQQCWTYRCLAR